MSKKEQILEYFKDINVAYNDYTMHDTLEHMLEDLEEVRHGHWVDEGKKFLPIYCSRCGFGNVYEDQRNYVYCPNCGAKRMRWKMTDNSLYEELCRIRETFLCRDCTRRFADCPKMTDTDKLVNLLNQLIEEAVEDGGDAGGAYNQNQEGLTNAINNILDYLELSDYKVVGTNDYSCWSRIKIGSKGETI